MSAYTSFLGVIYTILFVFKQQQTKITNSVDIFVGVLFLLDISPQANYTV
jgi:hypothetical protein